VSCNASSLIPPARSSACLPQALVPTGPAESTVPHGYRALHNPHQGHRRVNMRTRDVFLAQRAKRRLRGVEEDAVMPKLSAGPGRRSIR